MKIILCITYTGFQYENLKSQDTVAPIKLYTMDVAEFDTNVDVDLRSINIKTDITNLDSDAKLYYKINGEFKLIVIIFVAKE